MLIKNIILTIALTAAFLMAAGCAQTKNSALYRNWGYAYEIARHDQISDSKAGKNAEAVTGMDGQIAQKSYTLYRNGFTKAASSSGTSSDLKISSVK
jgi:hypothetical protein